jgi:hypothetical protein
VTAATISGIKIFDCSNGDLISFIQIPNLKKVSKVELSYSNKEFAFVFEDKNGDSFIRIINLK